MLIGVRTFLGDIKGLAKGDMHLSGEILSLSSVSSVTCCKAYIFNGRANGSDLGIMKEYLSASKTRTLLK